MEPYADVVEQYSTFEADAQGESPCFAAWARGVAEDSEVQRWLAGLPRLKQQPNLVFAAARWHGVPAPGPYDDLRAALLADDGTIRQTILTRSTQTNEVGRLATLVPAFAQLAGAGPVALVEVGASAGLCLYPDRYRYVWTTPAGRVTTGAADAPELACQVSGPAPLPDRLPTVSWRGGIDLNPLDVTDHDATAWLGNLVWPEQEARRERLARAVGIARRDPPHLVRGNLLDALPAALEEAEQHGRVVVFHSAVIVYLEPADRDRFQAMMAGLVGAGACHWVSNEGQQVLPAVTATAPAAPDPARRFVLGIDGRAVAWTHGHGDSMVWM